MNGYTHAHPLKGFKGKTGIPAYIIHEKQRNGQSLKTELLSRQQGKKPVNWITEEVSLWCMCSASTFTIAFIFTLLNICKWGWLFWVLQINPDICIFYWTLRVVLFNAARETKTRLTQGQGKPRNQGMDIFPNSPASSLPYPQAESWHYRVSRGKSVFQQLAVTLCSLAHSKIAGYGPGLQGGHQWHTLAFCSPLPSLHEYFSPLLLLLKDLFFLPPHDRLFSPHQTAKLLFQAYKCVKNINCVFRPSSGWKSEQRQLKF